ncbi:uncharacterized protein LOC143246051 [Tachypleus tridentatus]|uniref:uncharacterized protein LOC143246051 n=1 Tax=Tachypleus tridentatus TaxID=6853 RepID=UPI003FD010F6
MVPSARRQVFSEKSIIRKNKIPVLVAKVEGLHDTSALCVKRLCMLTFTGTKITSNFSHLYWYPEETVWHVSYIVKFRCKKCGPSFDLFLTPTNCWPSEENQHENLEKHSKHVPWDLSILRFLCLGFFQ